MTKGSLAGSAIVLTVLAVSALLTIGLGMARLVPGDFRFSLALESSLAAEQAAWAGVEYGLALLRAQPMLELSASYPPGSSDSARRPYGYSPEPKDQGKNCHLNRAAAVCRGLDRQLGLAVNLAPYAMSHELLGPGASYRVAIWHRRVNVGNPYDLDDGLTDPTIRTTRHGANINPILERDEVRRLDSRDISQLTIRWQPIKGAGCHADDAATKTRLAVTWLDKAGQPVLGVTRTLYDYPTDGRISLPNPGGELLSLSFLVTSDAEEKIADCFMRYSLENVTGETADLGFDVIESTGESGGVGRKIRLLVDREGSRLLNIFDFGDACEECRPAQ